MSFSDAAIVAAGKSRQEGARSGDLVEKVSRLQARLRDRPRDRRALKELYAALYALKDYSTAAEIVRQAISCGEFSGELHLQLGRCLFRKWPQWKQVDDLEGALVAFQAAMTDKTINCLPVVYLELVTVYSRLGKYQDAMDTIGAFMVIFKDFPDFMMIAQYNVAVIMCLAGRFEEAVMVRTRAAACGNHFYPA